MIAGFIVWFIVLAVVLACWQPEPSAFDKCFGALGALALLLAWFTSYSLVRDEPEWLVGFFCCGASVGRLLDQVRSGL